MLKIGLTGGIGSGKSTAANLFADLGIPIIDMDVLAREIVEPGQVALQEIKKLFGDNICNAHGELDRSRLRKIIFADPLMRKQLENIIHPKIRDRVRKLLAMQESPYCIIVIPLLFETQQQDLVDRILVIDSTVGNQIKRTMQRDNISESYVRDIMETQVARDLRLEKADDVIQNTGNKQELASQVRHLHSKYLELSRNLTAKS